MGTRHLQIVIDKNGETKLSQYGQWDGYPEGQGIAVLEFLRDCNLNKYHKEVTKLTQVTEEQLSSLEKMQDWKLKYPYMSRDCGSDIHEMIEKGIVEFVHLEPYSLGGVFGIEGVYTIDFKEHVFKSIFHGKKVSFSLGDLPTNEDYLSAFKQ